MVFLVKSEDDASNKIEMLRAEEKIMESMLNFSQFIKSVA